MLNAFILIFATGLLLVTILITSLYLVYYCFVINRRLSDQTYVQKRKLWSPMRVCLTTIIIMLSVFAIICVFLLIGKSTVPSISVSNYHAEILLPEEMQEGYLSTYSIDENAGYEKTEKVIDHVKYTYFISTEGADAFHPYFLIYAEYLGDHSVKYYNAEVSFQTYDGNEITGCSVGGCEIKDTVVCIVGNAFADCNVSCMIEFYNEERQEFDIEKMQEENTPLIFSVPIS